MPPVMTARVLGGSVSAPANPVPNGAIRRASCGVPQVIVAAGASASGVATPGVGGAGTPTIGGVATPGGVSYVSASTPRVVANALPAALPAASPLPLVPMQHVGGIANSGPHLANPVEPDLPHRLTEG